MDLARLGLFFLILSRMSGFVLFNPLLGRSNIPAYVKSGFILLLGFTTYSMTDVPAPEIRTVLEMGVLCLLGPLGLWGRAGSVGLRRGVQ